MRIIRIVACLLLMTLAAGATAQTPVDYDLDDNNLIDVRTRAQLEAITHDLTGVGNAAAAAYGTAFPDAMQGMGCATTCTGYELLNDLDLAGGNWSPIGGGGGGDEPPASTRYEAVFEGNGYVIRNMTVNASHNHVGLFSVLGTFGVIRSVGLVDAVVTGNSVNTGGLVGTSSGTIAASYVAGGTVRGVWVAGGLVGRLIRNAVVIASYADVSVSARSASGGLVGSMNDASIVSASYTIGRVEVRDGGGNGGGLAGERSMDNAGIQALQASYFDLERSGQTSCCGGGSAPSPDETPRESAELRGPTTAEGIYAGWDQLNVDNAPTIEMGVATLHDDAPWDFGSNLEYPVLRGTSARFPSGNSTNIRAQRQRQPPLLVALSQRDALITEGSTALYAVELDGVVDVATMSWSVELTGVGAGHAEASDFVGATRGQVVLVNTASAVFGVGIASDGTPDRRKGFRVRVSDLQSLNNLRLSAARSAVASVIASHGTDYDADDNDLIDVTTTSQLAAIRYDLNGRGLVGVGSERDSEYEDAFPFFDEAETCPGGCKGYELLNDLDLSSIQNWTPIGGGWPGNLTNVDPISYKATLEGNGHVIRNLRISTSRWYAALFSALSERGVIRNVGLVDVDVNSGGLAIGSLVGRNDGTVAASYAVGGTVRASAGAGGLMGVNEGTIVASYANVTVSANSANGGLVWFNNGRVIASYSYGVNGGCNTCGGLVSIQNQGHQGIESSYYDRDRGTWGDGFRVPSSPRKGGDELRRPTTATGLYADWGRLNVDNTTGTVGGVMTINDDAPWDFGNGFDYPLLRGISARYPGGNTTNIRVQRRLQQSFGFAALSRGDTGPIEEDTTVTYAVELNGVVDRATIGWSVELTGVGAAHAEASDFVEPTRGRVVLVNTASAVFQIGIARDQASEQREMFRVRLSDVQGPENLHLSAASSAVVSFIRLRGMTDYDADDNRLVEVATTSQLAAIRHDLGGGGVRGVAAQDLDAYEDAFASFDGASCPGGCIGYELASDLDLAGVNWEPIGGGNPLEYYSAVFEGNGYIISMLRIASPRLDNAGLFGALGRRGRIRNVGLRDVNVVVEGGAHTGALVGRNEGTVAACYVAGGRVEGVQGAGGLAGANVGTVIASYADVAVHANGHRSGGLIGQAAAGSVVSASYAVGMVTGGTFGGRTIRGGLLGGRDESDAAVYDVQASYYDRERSGQTSCCGGNAPSSDDGTSRTSAELRLPTAAAGTLYAGWDRLNVDGVDQGGDLDFNDDAPWYFGSILDYPVLRGGGARYPAGNSTNIGVQRRLLPPVLVTLSRRGDGLIAEGSVVTYAVELAVPVRIANAATMNWSVELTGVGSGHAETSDFVGATSGQVLLSNTASAVFRVRTARDATPEPRESFRVRLSDLEGADNLRLSVAASAVVSIIAPNGMDYDADDNNLIEVATTSQLAAIRYDLGGKGPIGVDDTDKPDYERAFPFFGEAGSCPRGCMGYELANDLDLSSAGNWTPLGGGGNPPEYYSAVFEGNGYIISNLRIASSALDHAGLFGAVSAGGIIRNVGLRDVDVAVGDGVYTSALVGRNEGTVAACYVAGGSVQGRWGTGALAGVNFGTLIASYADVEVHGNATQAGGLVGEAIAGSVVSASYSVGLVTGGTDGATTFRGGLLGRRNETDAAVYDVQASYYDRERSGQTSCCGGTAPSSDDETSRTSVELRNPTMAAGTIYAGWDRLNVDGVDQGGDLDFNDDAPWDFGSSLDYPVLRGVSARFPSGNSTNIGVQRRLLPPVLVTLSQRGDGLTAEGSLATYAVELAIPVGVATAATMNWSVELTGVGSGHAEASDFGEATRGQVLLINTASAVFRVRTARDAAREFRERFRVRLSDLESANNLRLSVAASAVESIIAPNGMDYDADDNNLIEVATTSQLAAIRYDLGGKGPVGVDDTDKPDYERAFPFFGEAGSCPRGCMGYELANDLDLSSAGNWTPLGGGGNPLEYYSAVFEGNGYIISNLRIASSALDHAGLFGAVSAGGIIRNVGLRDVNVAVGAGVYTSALVGRNEGTVAACYVLGGSVQGVWATGALAGFSSGTVIASYADVKVHANAHRAGGLIGEAIAGAVVSASYSVGMVTGGSYGGSTLRGSLLGGGHETNAPEYVVQASYYDSERSEQTTCCGGIAPPSDEETRRTTVELRSPTMAAGTLYADWERLNVDGVDQDNNGSFHDDAPWDFGTRSDYPVLRGVSTRFPSGNSTNISVQQRLQSPVSPTLSLRGGGLVAEGSTATYGVRLDFFEDGQTVAVDWAVEFGAGAGYAEAADFDGAISGTVSLVNTGSGTFQVAIRDDNARERRERFRVQLGAWRGGGGAVRLNAASSAVTSVIAASDGTNYDVDGNGLIEVRNRAQLQAMRYDLGGRGLSGVAASDEAAYEAAFPFFDEEACADGCDGYELLNDLDLSGMNWTPIGGGVQRQLPGFLPPGNRYHYNATFEGHGHVISGLDLSNTSRFANSVGLFGVLGSRGVVRNVGLVNVNVNAPGLDSYWVGALVGANYGKVAASYAVGGTVRGSNGAGGLTGRNEREIVAAYAAVTVRVRRDWGGGLVGRNTGGSIIASYARSGLNRISFISGARNFGGLAGLSEGSGDRGAVIRGSYYASDVGGWGRGGAGVPGSTARSGAQLRNPTTAVGTIYAGWDRLSVDRVDQDADGNFNDDAPWDFGNSLDYPVLRGVSARFPAGNSTNIGVQRRLQPPVLATLSQRGGSPTAEGSVATYTVELAAPVRGADTVTMSWSVELSGAGDGHAEASDFVGATRGQVVLINTASAVFGVRTARDETPEPRERFRVRLSDLQGPDNLRLSVAASAVASVITSNGIDYDADDNNLIEVATTSQLAAIRYDLGGKGPVGVERTGRPDYERAFPFFDEAESCPRGCKGYELTNDLDLSSAGNWRPIGGGDRSTAGDGNVLPEQHRYNAVFEGNGHVIRRLKLNTGSDVYHFAGLFRALGRNGIIRNVGLMDVDLRVDIRSIHTGALAGANYDGKVAASYVAGGVVSGGWGVGGLVSVNTGTIIASYSDVLAETGASGVGGLVNFNSTGGRVIASYSLAGVQRAISFYPGEPLNGGGLVGTNNGRVESSYFNRERSFLSSGGAKVPASAVQTTRGLRDPTAAEGIYAAWDGLDVDNTTGTFMGVMTLDDDSPWDFGSSLEYPVLRGASARYPAGNSTAIRAQQRRQPPVLVTLSQRTVGALAEDAVAEYAVGLDDYGASPVTLSWAAELTGVGAGHAEASDFAGATSGEVVLVNTDSAVFGIAIRDDGALETAETFRVRLRNPRGSVRLRLGVASSSVVSSIALNGMDYDTNDNNLIEVATTSQLAAIRYDLGGRGPVGVDDTDRPDYERAFPFFDEAAACPGGCMGYELAKDLDLSSAGLWRPLGGGVANRGSGNGEEYAATFEGNGFVISSMSIVSSSRLDNAGLFGIVGAMGEIRNVGLSNAQVDLSSGSVVAGALAGLNKGRIAASYVAGSSVRTGRDAGGLVAVNEGTVIACYANAEVRAKHPNGDAGGLMGVLNHAGVVSASYSIGMPTGGGGGGRSGGVAGFRASGGVIQGSYFDRERGAPSSCCGGNSAPPTDPAPRTSDALRAPTAAAGTIYAGWDKLNTDGVDQGDDRNFNDDAPWDFGTFLDYPVLRQGRTEAAVQAQYMNQPAVTLTPKLAGDAVVSEGERANYVVSLEGTLPSDMAASWSWAVGGGMADAGDFAGPLSGRVIIGPGRSSASFSLVVAADGVAEVDEAFAVSLGDATLVGAPAAVNLGVPTSAQTTIAANELGQVTVAAQSPTVAEGATATFTLRLDGGGDGGGGDVTVHFQIVAVSGSVTPADFERMTWVDREGTESTQVSAVMGSAATTGTVVLSMADSATVSVAAAADGVPGEGAEQFGLQLTGCQDCGRVHPIEIGVPSSAQVTISRIPLTVSAQVYLQGAYAADGSGMKTTLAGRLPQRQPYGAAPWSYPAPTEVPHVDGQSGLRQVTSTLVDWVLVELRASTPGAGAGAALPTKNGFAAGLLLSDGRVAGINEAAAAPAAALSLNGVRVEAEFAQGSDIYVLVHHRNHLSVMSARPAPYAAPACGADYCMDFRNVQSYEGCAQSCGADGVCLMVAGDVNRSGVVSWGDDDLVLGNQGRFARYTPTGANYQADADLDFSGRVSSADLRVIIANHLLASECSLSPAIAR